MNTATRNLSQLITNSCFHQWSVITRFSLQNDEVHLWLIHLPESKTKAKFEALHQFKQERRLILINILKRYTQKPFQIQENPHGKPFMNTHELAFSTSHSGAYLAIAISKNTIGLDIEQYRVRDFIHFSKGFFKDGEKLKNLPYYLQGRHFYQQWVQTEALVKYQGETIFNYTENLHHTFYFEPRVGLMAAIMQDKPFLNIKKIELNWHDVESYQQNISSFHEKELQEKLHTQALKLYCLTSIDSTQEYIKRLPDSKDIIICQSHFQTKARGRFGRTWISPPDVNLYVSIRLTVHRPVQELEGLSLVMGMAIARMLEVKTGIQISVKWPNDIYYQGKKLAGILIECINTNLLQSTLIIGIGLNVNAKAESLPETATSLYEITQQTHDNMDLLKQLMIDLLQGIAQFEQKGFESFLKDWQKYDLLYQKNICIQQDRQILNGVAKGVNPKGYLILQDENNQLHEVGSGETSIQSFSK